MITTNIRKRKNDPASAGSACFNCSMIVFEGGNENIEFWNCVGRKRCALCGKRRVFCYKLTEKSVVIKCLQNRKSFGSFTKTQVLKKEVCQNWNEIL